MARDARVAAQAELSPELKNILGFQAPKSTPAPASPTAAPSTTKAPVKIKTVQERDALPSGTVYIDPNGVTRTKS
jgi:hypothetical protein